LSSYKVLFSTGSLAHLPLKEIFALARKAGFDGCDLVIQRHLDDEAYRETLAEAASILPVLALHVPFERLRSWGNQVQALTKSVSLADEFDIPVVCFHPPSWFHLELSFLWWFRKVKDFQKELGCCKACVALENMPLMGGEVKRRPYVLNHFKDLIKFGVERNLYFTFDTTHLATFEHDAIDAFLAYARTGRLKHIHLSDYAAERSHLFPGAGELPLERLLDALEEAGYDCSVSLEVAPHEMPEAPDALEAMLCEAASFLKKAGKAK
jgi:sugar phosphate isomerase/epimerase